MNPDRRMLMYSWVNFKHTAPFSILTKIRCCFMQFSRNKFW